MAILNPIKLRTKVNHHNLQRLGGELKELIILLAAWQMLTPTVADSVNYYLLSKQDSPRKMK